MKLLIVRLRLIGDVVFTTPLIRALRRRYPDAHLTYLVESAAAPVVADSLHLSTPPDKGELGGEQPLIAHLLALREFPGRRAALRSQYPMVALMIAYTMSSLWIIAQPIVTER